MKQLIISIVIRMNTSQLIDIHVDFYLLVIGLLRWKGVVDPDKLKIVVGKAVKPFRQSRGSIVLGRHTCLLKQAKLPKDVSISLFYSNSCKVWEEKRNFVAYGAILGHHMINHVTITNGFTSLSTEGLA